MCTVLLAVIGSGWLSFGPSYPANQDGPVDWVRLEIADALARAKRVIPVLVEDTPMPTADQLPPDLAALIRCQAVRLHDSDVTNGIAQIAQQIRDTTPEPRHKRRPPAPGVVPHVRLFRVDGASPSAPRIGIVAGDIRQVRFADIWVNSENTDMEMSRVTEFSVSAIIRYYGAHRDRAGRVLNDLIARELARRTRPARPVAPGAAIVTGPGDLSASHNVRHLIHVAAVHGEPGTGFRQIRNIDDCVTNTLAAAEELAGADPSVRTILIPLLGTGAAGAGITATVHALLRATIDHITARQDYRLQEIYFLAYTRQEVIKIDEVISATPLLVPIGT